MLAINAIGTSSEKGEQHGFANLGRDIRGTVRAPTAHEPRINWTMSRDAAENLLSIVLLIHPPTAGRRGAHMPPRA